MKQPNRPDHCVLAEALRRKVLEGPALTSPKVRQRAAESATGRVAISNQSGYSGLAHQIGEAAPLVTDAQVAAAVASAGSEKAAFEIIMAAAVGAGLLRWQEGMRAFEEASHEVA